jgi:hypothetical protein
VGVVAEEQGSAPRRLLVIEGFVVPPVRSNVLVKIEELHPGIAFPDFLDGLEGSRAADAGTVLVQLPVFARPVYTFVLPAPHAVDEPDGPYLPAVQT